VALLTTQSPTIAGTAPTYGAVSASDTIANVDDRMFLIVKNASGTVDTVTLAIPGSDQFGSPVPDPTITVPITTGERWILLTPQMADPATGLVTVTHSQTTSVTCALVRR
jgi:hypothetical protein